MSAGLDHRMVLRRDVWRGSDAQGRRFRGLATKLVEGPWQVAGGMDKVILTTVINAAVGFVLAWYIPQAAAAGRFDPFAHASQERVPALETAAKARLGESAPDWCDRSHPVLGGTSPRVAAAANVDGFERAVDLLQGPSALSA